MFKVKDLMIDVLLARGGGGGAAQPAPTEPTPPSPISPYAAVASLERRLQTVDKVMELRAPEGARVLEDLAVELGRVMVGARAAAYCTEDMATCANNEPISPFASRGLAALREADFGAIREQVLQMADWVNERGDLLEKRAVEHKKELIPRLEGALKFLKSS